jgi:hypothetical protein
MKVTYIPYKPFRYLSWIKLYKVKLPENWSDLTKKQFLALPYVQNKPIDELIMLRKFLGIKKNVIRDITEQKMFFIRHKLKFLDKREPLDYFIFDRVLWFKSPQPGLKDVSFRALTLGLTYFQDYLKGDEYSLYKFIACFYCKKRGVKNDLIEFDENLMSRNSDIMIQVDIQVKRAIVVNFDLICAWLEETYPYVFQGLNTILKINNSYLVSDILENLIVDGSVNIELRKTQPVVEVLNFINEKLKISTMNNERIAKN